MHENISASGTVSITAPLASWVHKPTHYMSATGSSSFTGRAATMQTVLPMGGLTDLGMWDVAQPDAAMTRALGQSVTTDGATPARSALTATAPARYAPAGGDPLWHRATYASLTLQWNGVPAGQKHAWHQVQFERASNHNRLSWEATSWEDRRCYIADPAVVFCTVETSDEAAASGQRSGKITYTGSPMGTWAYYITPIAPSGMAPCVGGEYLSGSVSLSIGRQAWWTAGLHFYDANFASVGSSSWYNNAAQQHPGSWSWDTSYVYRIQAPAGAAWVAMVPHINVNSTTTTYDNIAPIGEISYVDMHRIWGPAYNTTRTPTTYTAPRKLTVDIQANRVNLVRNPSATVDYTGWGSSGTGDAPFPLSRDLGQGRSRPGALKYSLPGTLSSYAGVREYATLTGLTGYSTKNALGYGVQSATYYTQSMYVKRSSLCPDVRLDTWYPKIAGVTSVIEALESHPELIEDEWVRLWYTYRTGQREDGLVLCSASVRTAEVTGDCAFWVDDVLIEEGSQLRPFFDGDTPGSGHLWSGTANFSASHYYRGFKSQAYRLQSIVESVVPHGTQVEIRYARPPE